MTSTLLTPRQEVALRFLRHLELDYRPEELGEMFGSYESICTECYRRADVFLASGGGA